VATPGRSCPSHYRYSPRVFSREPSLEAKALYVVGGLYGNPFALEAVFALARRENAALVFNGDFNWFNAEPAEFREVNQRSCRTLAGQCRDRDRRKGQQGCGCAYPEWVADAEVARSNRILERLRETARRFPELRARLRRLPMHLVAQVGGLRVGIAHGDAESLAGWQFSQEALREHPGRAQAVLAGAGIDVFA
jgi:hypothetical protein